MTQDQLWPQGAHVCPAVRRIRGLDREGVSLQVGETVARSAGRAFIG